MKKIIFIVSTLNTGGAQKILSNLLMNLPEQYEAYIVLNDVENIAYPYKGKLVNLGFKEQTNKLSIWYQMRVFVRRVCLLWKMKRSGEFEAAYSFLDSANIANIISGKRHCKTILSVHNNLTQSAASPVYKYLVNPLVKILYEKADKVITVSKGIKYDLVYNLRLPDKNIVTIYNGHDVDGIRKMALEPVPKEAETYFCKEPVIVTMGRLEYQKGQWHLIRALKQVKSVYPDIRLLILGEGELESYLKQLAVDCDLEDNVIFCGFLKNPFSLLARCEGFVLPSMFEGFPNALIEALACGLPCISTDFRSGAREILAPRLSVCEQTEDVILEGDFGLLTPVCDGKQYDGRTELTTQERFLAEAVLRLLKEKRLREQYSKKSAEAVKNLDTKRMTEKWLEIMKG